MLCLLAGGFQWWIKQRGAQGGYQIHTRCQGLHCPLLQSCQAWQVRPFWTSPGAGDIRKACTVPEFHSAGVHEFKEGTRSYRIVHRTIQGEIESIVRRDVDEFGDEASMLALVCLSRWCPVSFLAARTNKIYLFIASIVNMCTIREGKPQLSSSGSEVRTELLTWPIPNTQLHARNIHGWSWLAGRKRWIGQTII